MATDFQCSGEWRAHRAGEAEYERVCVICGAPAASVPDTLAPDLCAFHGTCDYAASFLYAQAGQLSEAEIAAFLREQFSPLRKDE